MSEEGIKEVPKTVTQPESGVAYLKKEYIVEIEKINNKNDLKKKADELDSTTKDDEPHKKKFKQSGRNYKRPKLIKVPKGSKLCRSYWCLLPGEKPDSDKCSFPNCSFSHDVESYLKNKPKDLGDKCHNFETYGFCPYGIICRFGNSHIKDNGSIVNEEHYIKHLETPSTSNTLTKEVQFLLRKKKYNFSKASKASSLSNSTQSNIDSTLTAETNGNISSSSLGKDKVLENENLIVLSDTSKPEPESQVADIKDVPKSKENRLGPTSNEDLIKLRPAEKKKINWENKVYVGPLTTLGNLPFRRVCKKLGADVTCSEMAVATCLLQGSSSEWALVKRHSSEDCFGVQLCGSNVDTMVRCAQLLDNEINMDFVDINMGCPIDLIFTQGAGSALMRRTGVLRQMVSGMNKVLSCPLTLKMRSAIYNSTKVAHSIIQEAKLWDVSLITVHGRSKEQRYLKLADWDYIEQCAKVASPVPLFGNGDVLTYEDYNNKKNGTNVAGIMLARGVLMKPWLLTEIKEQRHWDISSSERLDILKDFVNYGLEHWGSDTEGVEKTRRFLLEWLSFLHRYIPVGLLEQPQKMNQRPPLYIGRNDLETLMASTKVDDWVRISEMLLGPVPECFEFLPKHQANSWS